MRCIVFYYVIYLHCIMLICITIQADPYTDYIRFRYTDQINLIALRFYFTCLVATVEGLVFFTYIKQQKGEEK